MAKKRLTLEEDLRRLEAVDDYLSKNHPERRFERKDRSYCKEIGYIQTLRKHYGNGLELLGGFQGDVNSVNTIECDVFECTEALELTTETSPFNDQFDVEDWLYRLEYVCDKVLTPREKIILFKFFGIKSDQAYDLALIADEVNISKERARQLKEKAIRKLKHPKCRAWLMPDPDIDCIPRIDRKNISAAIEMIINGGKDSKVVFRIYLNEDEVTLAMKLLSLRIRDQRISFIKGESQVDLTCTLDKYLTKDDAEVVDRYKREYSDTLSELIRFCNKVDRLPRSNRERRLYDFMMNHLDNPKIQELRSKYRDRIQLCDLERFCKWYHRLPDPDIKDELPLWNWMKSHQDDDDDVKDIKIKYSPYTMLDIEDLKYFCITHDRLPGAFSGEYILTRWMSGHRDDPEVRELRIKYSRLDSERFKTFCEGHNRLPNPGSDIESHMYDWMMDNLDNPAVKEIRSKYLKNWWSK